MLLPTPVAQDQALAALAQIRTAIDRCTRYSTFSALSGFVAGGAALAGSGLCGLYPFAGTQPQQQLSFVWVWVGVLVAAAVSLFALTALKARQRGEEIWTPIARTALSALCGAGLAGSAATLAFIHTQQWLLLPGLWLTFYGCGLWAVSFFAPLFIRFLGVAFMAFGIVAWLKPESAALWLGLGFGGLHLLFGALVLARYQR